MKSQEVIGRRLRTLRVRYTKQYIATSQERSPCNCVYNHEQIPTGHYTESKYVDVDIAPRRTATLVVIQPQSPVRICMYGAENPSQWMGSICDDVETASGCGWFKPKVSAKQARDEFLGMLSDDEYVYDNYRDVAALQWVLDDRIYRKSLSVWERFILWWSLLFTKVKPPTPLLPDKDIPDDIWGDHDIASDTGS